jgi:hypothetical protein
METTEETKIGWFHKIYLRNILMGLLMRHWILKYSLPFIVPPQIIKCLSDYMMLCFA